jgi:hypothetical protein
MKRAILLTTLATISLASIAQKKETVNPAPAVKQAETKTNDTLLIDSKVKFIKIGEKLFSTTDLGNPGTVALVVPIEWIAENFQYLDNSSGGYSKKQIEELQKPLAAWYRYYIDLIQQQRQQSQKKQE